MEDLRIKFSLVEHPKVLKLMRRCGPEAFYCLVKLWCQVAQNKPDGILKGWDREDIEIAAGWRGEPDKFVNTLIEVRLLEDLEGCYAVHDWLDHNPWVSGHEDRSDTSRFSKLGHYPGLIEFLKEQGIKKVSKEFYRTLVDAYKNGGLEEVKRIVIERYRIVNESLSNDERIEKPNPNPNPNSNSNSNPNPKGVLAKSHSPTSASSGGESEGKTPSSSNNGLEPEYLDLATRLAGIIQSQKQIKVSKQRLKSWGKEIRKLRRMDGVDVERISQALDWYGQHIGEQFVPVIESGKAFRDKFLRLEDAMKREARAGPQNGSKKLGGRGFTERNVETSIGALKLLGVDVDENGNVLNAESD